MLARIRLGAGQILAIVKGMRSAPVPISSQSLPKQHILDSGVTRAEDKGRLPLKLDAGITLGPYRIDSPLGAGGMGEVYRATDTRLDRTVAIKILPADLQESTERRERFKREARIISQLTHPHICTLHDVGHELGIDFLVMEYLEGETLAARLSSRAMSVEETLALGIEITDALDHAHRRGIVHRDLKPANVMLTSMGVKLLDFGIARARTAGTSATNTTHTATGAITIAGTPPYMAPEQTLGLAVTPRSDLYALGVILFQCLTGVLPSRGSTFDEYLQATARGRIRIIDTLAPAAPPALRLLVGMCLSTEPVDRPSSAASVREELRAIKDGLPQPRSAARVIAGVLALAAIIAALAGVYRLWLDHGSVRVRAFANSPLVTDPGADYDGRLSPDGRWMSFISDRDGTPGLFLQSLDGNEARPIKVPGDAVLSHAWSPDGRELACIVRQKEQTLVEIVAAFTGGMPRVSGPLTGNVEEVRVTHWAASGIYLDLDRGFEGLRHLLRADPSDLHMDDITARWPAGTDYRGFDVSPDGREVVFVASVGTQMNLWSARIDGSGRRQLTKDPWINRNPIWVGGTGRIAFQTNRTGHLDLWILDPSTGMTTPVTSGPSAERPTDSTADGSAVVFEQTVDEATLWSQDPSTSHAHQLTANALSDFWPSVSADGQWLAFQRTQPTLTRGYNFLDARVLVARLESGRLLLPEIEASEQGIDAQLSSDGTWVAYLRRAKTSTDYGLWVRNLHTTEKRLLAANAAPPVMGQFSPFDVAGQVLAWNAAGPTLYFVKRVEGGQEIARLDLSRGEVETVEPADEERVRDLRPSLDGSKLAYLRWSPARRTFRLRVHGLNTSNDDRAWPEENGTAYLRGWTASGGLILVLSTLNADGTTKIAVEERHGIADRRWIATLDGALAITSRLNASGTRLYFTRSMSRIHNIWYVDLADGKISRLTDNEQLGVSYSGVAALLDGSVVYSRAESKQDLWIARSNQHP